MWENLFSLKISLYFHRISRKKKRTNSGHIFLSSYSFTLCVHYHNVLHFFHVLCEHRLSIHSKLTKHFPWFFYSTGSYYTIRLGDHNRNTDEGTEQSIRGKRVIKHPSYNSPSPINNDIALIQLERPATLNSRVGTVCLPSHDEVVPPSARCYITGL